MPLGPRPVSAVIFDLDGLLLDTEPLYQRATSEVVRRYGRTLDEAVWFQHIGRPSPQVAAGIVATHELPVSAEAFDAERYAILDELLPSAPPRPGAVELSTRLAARGVPIAIGTSSSRATFELKAAPHARWLTCFDQIVTSEDVEHGKPAPDIFLEAARRLGRPPADCLVFEDATSGMQAAQAAGMAVVLVPSGPVNLATFEPPDAVLDSLLAFEAAAWGLLPADPRVG